MEGEMKNGIVHKLITIIVFTVLFSACSGAPLPTAPPTPTATATPMPTAAPTPITLPTPNPGFPLPFSDIVPSGFDSVFWHKIQELTEEYFMGLQYSFMDVDGDGDDELIVNHVGSQLPSLSIYKNVGGEAVLSLKAAGKFYMNGQGGFIVCSGFFDENYHLYYGGFSEAATFEYQGYSLGRTDISDQDAVYYLIEDREKSYSFISNYYDGRRNEEFRIWDDSSMDGTPIDLSPYLIDESEYRSLLDTMLEGYTELDIYEQTEYLTAPAREFGLNDEPGKITIDYLDDDYLVFHGKFGLFVYDFEQGRIITSFENRNFISIDKNSYGARVEYLRAKNDDGSESLTLQLCRYDDNELPSWAYRLALPSGLCSFESYDPQYEEFVTQEDGSVLFGDGTRGEILCDASGTIGGLYYTRGDDKWLLFETNK